MSVKQTTRKMAPDWTDEMAEISKLSMDNRVLQGKIERLSIALFTIRDMPTESQDNMISANMRKIARDTLEINR